MWARFVAIVSCLVAIHAFAQDEGWTQKTDGGGSISVKDGWTTFEGRPGSVAHLERANHDDNITISCTLARWAAIDLVWDANNWVGLGKTSPTPFGRFSSIDVVGGKANEFDHRGVDFDAPHLVRIELGRDFVAFQFQLDREVDRSAPHGATERIRRRSKILAAGKYYGADDRVFGVAQSPMMRK